MSDQYTLADLLPKPARQPNGQTLAKLLQPPYNSFLTSLPAGQEMAFQQWVSQNRVPFDPSPQADYDMRGFWRALQAKDPRAVSGMNANDGMLHYPDYWKTPYHQSYSGESKWNTTGSPMWNEQGQLIDKGGRVVFDEKKR